jgi:Ni/Fe-hydrogenase subunit HybB-like protein
MATNSSPALTAAGYAGTQVTKAPEWHLLVSLDNLFNGLATGLFLVTSLAELAVPDAFLPLARFAYPLALIFLLADLACLTLDLGDPLRFHHMLRLVKLRSPMSFGVWSLTIFSFFLTAAIVLSLIPEPGPVLSWARRLVAAVGLVPALCAAAYKGVLFSTTAQPVWRDARWLGSYFTSSALLIGVAEATLLGMVFGPEQAVVLLRPALGLVLVLHLISLGLLLSDVYTGLRRVYRPGQLAVGGLVIVGAGAAIPLILLLAGGGLVLQMPAALLVLLGALFVRFEMVQIPHAVQE